MKGKSMRKTIDVRALDCPKPVIETQKAIKEADVTELEILIGNPTAKENLKRFAETGKYAYDLADHGDGTFTMVIKKEAGETVNEAADNFVATCDIPVGGKTILIASDTLGKGEEELGKLLMKSFVYTLTQTEPYPEKVLLLNSAVRLSTQNEEIIEHLKDLESKGTKVFSCGTCLNFYQLAEELKVGAIGNMYDVVEALYAAPDTITIG